MWREVAYAGIILVVVYLILQVALHLLATS
jgi:hypothetical protein